ncbi:MAG: response regulator [Chloroflexota bacterium]
MTEEVARSRLSFVVRSFPRADRAFQLAIERILAQDATLDPADPESAARLERQLHDRYPGARVRLQDPLAKFGGEPPVWYAYRRDVPAAADPAPETADAAATPVEAADDGAAAPTRRAGPGAKPVYSAAAAAAMVGVPIGVLVRWDADNGLVRPSVTREGQRLYSRNDIEDLLFLKRETTADRPAAELRAALDDRRRGSGSSGAERAGSRRLLVLLAERDPYAAEYAEYFLRTEGYDVEVAFDAGEAQAAATSLKPDVVVVELLISGGAGAELCARIKAGGTSAVLAISSLDHEDSALRAGADAFLVKPLDPLQFVSTIKDLLGDSALLHSRPQR